MVRFKHRWILFQVNQDPVIENGQIVYPRTSLRLNDQMISRAIYNQIEIYYGQFGKGLGSVAVKWYNPDTRIGIMRIPRDYTNMYLSTMFYMNKVASVPCSISILRVSGTIIFVQTAAIEWDRTYYIREQEEAEKKGQHYSSAEKIEASKKQITSIS
ncbi:RNA-binding protein pop5 [Rhizopus azygosporus]|uniref:RNA-binding protein pop5 n=2 Tax=Rhizopus TaxID=4842 RepID=A0A367JF44_RHIAZ|nr:hypothetical protein BCV71DRAFT_230030 [Rhizopus microsporus]RCH88238.1 RNA-binding protein pop5 [Rhizopus azygosporus]RCH88495.1 RNA-binding protein pop5 [Rhizopus azygosporus]CEG85106.1 hypothetical protein RMATCC62417_18837 [Rhizopus microsporus]CEI93288.1 hypothetical protein RMCBS344292_07527 [Rhizopus microsporus]